MLDSIVIENLRGIRRLSLDDFGKVNIFLGTNAVGKTSVLEAISLAANPAFPQWLLTLSSWRDLAPLSQQQDDALRSYFFDLNPNVVPRIGFVADAVAYSVELQAQLDFDGPMGLGSGSGSASSGEAGQAIRAVTVLFRKADKVVATSKIELLASNVGMTPSRNVTKLGVFHISSRRSTSIQETARLLTSLYEAKREQPLIDLLHRVDPRVTRLWPGVRATGATVLVDIGLEQMLPLNLLGDGLCRVALMATGLLWETRRHSWWMRSIRDSTTP